MSKTISSLKFVFILSISILLIIVITIFMTTKVIMCKYNVNHVEDEFQTNDFKSFVYSKLNDKEVEIEGNEYYTLTKGDNEFEYNLYLHNDKEILFNESYPVRPYMYKINDSILEFSIKTGNPSPQYSFYYDVKFGKISDIYENSKLLNEEFIYYIEYLYIDEDLGYKNAFKRLTVRDIFNNQKFDIKLYRDFSWGWSPVDVIQHIELQANNTLYIEYLSGDEEDLIAETIELN